MPAVTVLLPTHNHVETLRHSVASVLRQSLVDFELFVVGDGIGDATRAIVGELAASDRRMRLFDFPKGERKGERLRHEALKEAKGRIVAYLGDDDLWMPHHLKTLDTLLREVDFANTTHIGLNEKGRMFWLASDLANPAFRARMLNDPPFNTFDMTFGGHTLVAYRRLKVGWSPPPPPCPADLFLWRQFLSEPWCRMRSATMATGICTHTHLRPLMTDHQRAEELSRLAANLSQPGIWQAVVRRVTAMPVGVGVK